MSVEIPDVYSIDHEKTSPHFAKAFAQGCGGRIFRHYQGGDWAGFGSPLFWKDINLVASRRKNFYYGDHGIIRRNIFYRVTKNSYFHNGLGKSDGVRARTQGFIPAPWRKDGKTIIICPQSEEHHLRYGLTRDEWITRTVDQLSRQTDRPIKIHGKWDRKPLQAFFNEAWAVVVHSSNSAVEAVLSGIPAFHTAPCTAASVACSDLSKIETPVYSENRQNFFNVLADNQWTLEEMARGMAWEKINAAI